jgi:hypothetical protein
MGASVAPPITAQSGYLEGQVYKLNGGVPLHVCHTYHIDAETTGSESQVGRESQPFVPPCVDGDERGDGFHNGLVQMGNGFGDDSEVEHVGIGKLGGAPQQDVERGDLLTGALSGFKNGQRIALPEEGCLDSYMRFNLMVRMVPAGAKRLNLVAQWLRWGDGKEETCQDSFPLVGWVKCERNFLSIWNRMSKFAFYFLG